MAENNLGFSLSLGIVASGSTRVTDEMIFSAARALSNEVAVADLQQGRIFPSLTRIREVSASIATVVAEIAFNCGLVTMQRPDDIPANVRSKVYEPKYR